MNESSLYKKLYLALQEISYTLVHTDKVTTVANSLLDVAVKFTSAEAGSLMLLNDQQELFILSSRGLPSEYIKRYRGALGEGIAGRIAMQRRPVLVQNIDEHPEFAGQQRGHYKTRSFISCPIIYRERLLGMININDKADGGPFTSEEFELLQIISNHAAVALENASLLAQLRLSAADLEQMNRRLVDSDLQKTEFLTRISHELRTPLNAVNGAIYFLQQHEDIGDDDLKEFHGIIASESRRLSTTVETLLKFLQIEDESRILNRTVISIDELLKELPAATTLTTSLKAHGVRLELTDLPGPLQITGDKIRIGQFFTSLLEACSHHLPPGCIISISARETDALLIELRLSAELPRTFLQQLNSSKSIFHRANTDDLLKVYLARSIALSHRWGISAENSDGACIITVMVPRNTRDTHSALVSRSMHAFVDHISEALHLDTCSVMLSDELTGELMVSGARGLDDDIVKRTRIKFGDRIAGWVALEGKPLFVENVEEDPRFAKKNIPQYSTKSFMSLPLKIDDRVVGVLNLNNKKESEPFTQRDYQIALALSSRMSEYLKRILNDRFQEDELKQFLSSVDALIRSKTRPETTPSRKSTS